MAWRLYGEAIRSENKVEGSQAVLGPASIQEGQVMKPVQHVPSLEHHHKHHLEPDRTYLIVVRTVLWVIAGAVFAGFALWWVLT